MNSYMLKIKRPHDKYKALHQYILDGNKIYRQDVLKMGFHLVEVSLYYYCRKHKLKLKQISHNCWEKTKEGTAIGILPLEMKKKRAERQRVLEKEKRIKKKIRKQQKNRLVNENFDMN